ncbi:hypothetical protein CD006_05570 [Enterobacter sp. 10-1]|nr:hypothetical protein CD006_05570 [Enterobacter sp. 10-1]
MCHWASESRWKNNTFGACFGSLRCPNGHYEVRITYMAGAESKARKKLTEQWNAEIRGRSMVFSEQ